MPDRFAPPDDMRPYVAELVCPHCGRRESVEVRGGLDMDELPRSLRTCDCGEMMAPND